MPGKKIVIKKKRINASSDMPLAIQTDAPVSACKYDAATNLIKGAIDALAQDASQGDALAKESIANLSVVLLDLKCE